MTQMCLLDGPCLFVGLASYCTLTMSVPPTVGVTPPLPPTLRASRERRVDDSWAVYVCERACVHVYICVCAHVHVGAMKNDTRMCWYVAVATHNCY